MLAAALEANGEMARLAAELREENARLRAQNAQQAAELESLRADLAVFQRMLFGRSSERSGPVPDSGDGDGGSGGQRRGDAGGSGQERWSTFLLGARPTALRAGRGREPGTPSHRHTVTPRHPLRSATGIRPSPTPGARQSRGEWGLICGDTRAEARVRGTTLVVLLRFSHQA